MSEKTQKLYDYFSTDNPGLGSFNEFESALQDSSKRRKFYDHFSPDNPGLGTFEEFEQNVLPTPTDTTVTAPKIELPDSSLITPAAPESTKIDTSLPTPPKKKEVQPQPIKQYNTDPGVYLAVADFEAGDRATRHNNFSAHIVPDDPVLRQKLIDDYGMEVGDPFKDEEGNTLYTAKYPDAESGKAAGEFIIDKVWAENDGDVEKFVKQYSGLDPNSEEYASYLGKVQDQVKNSLESQDLALKDLTNDKLWSVEEMGFKGSITGLPPKATGDTTPTDEFDFLVEKNKERNSIIDETTGAVKELAKKKRYQENLQAVFGQNKVDQGGIKIEETDPEVKNIITIREDLDYDTTMQKYNVARNL